MPTFLVLKRDQSLRQRVTFCECSLEALGEMIEYLGDSRKFGEIEGRQTRREVAGGQALESRLDRVRRPQCVCERHVSEGAKPEKSSGQDGEKVARLAPALRNDRLRIDPSHCLALRRIAHSERTR